MHLEVGMPRPVYQEIRLKVPQLHSRILLSKNDYPNFGISHSFESHRKL